MRNLSVSLFLLFTVSSLACGWYETAETIRLALFRSERTGSEKLRNFYYSADNYFQTYVSSKRDQIENCKEWQKELGGNVKWEDVYKLQYETDSEKFQTAYKSNTLKEVFKGNTFIESLTLPKNKVLLEYFSDAKHTEYNYSGAGKWESWDNLDRNYDSERKGFSEFQKKLELAKTEFLKQRYAYLLMRTYTVSPKEMVRLYDTHFVNSTNKTILQPWALFFKAISTENSAEANYYLSQVLASCDDKSFATMQNFNRKYIDETLSFAKNDNERGNIIAMRALRNPAPAFEDIKKVYEYIPQSDYFSFLIGREINKLEDWIFTPKFTLQGPAVKFSEEQWYKDYDLARKQNFEKDIKYLREFRNYLISIFPNVSGEQRDYMCSAIAQLCFMDDETQLGKRYTSWISSKANPSILAQKNIQLALVEVKLGDVNSEKTKNIILNSINELSDLAENDHSLFKSLYSLTRLIGYEYEKKKDIMTAGFLYTKSQDYRNISDSYESDFLYDSPKLNYSYIGYFERYASVKDMNDVIDLLLKKNKTAFEQYLTSGVAPIDFYRDVKGTIAFRNNDLELASKTFKSIDRNFWKNAYSYTDYLNENPFIPKALTYKDKRNYNYDFNKVRFIDEILRLKDNDTPENLLKLGHAYYNVSFFGNSWMMVSYGISSYEDTDATSFYYYMADPAIRKKNFQNGNYYGCTIAKEYYKKVLENKKSNKEQKAMALLMIHICNENAFSFKEYDSKVTYKAGKELYEFYSDYSDTKIFKRYSCPLLESYIK